MPLTETVNTVLGVLAAAVLGGAGTLAINHESRISTGETQQVLESRMSAEHRGQVLSRLDTLNEKVDKLNK